jgi:signal transduction histidine kinase/CheY-like chemotaxis protein
VVIPDMDASECDPEKTPHADVARAGVKAGQWTPLISRSGRLLGVMATYWSQPHHPDDRELRLLDLLTRQAADLIERHQSEAALREREQQLLELSQSLELRVEQRTAELKEQTARLQNLAAELSSAEQRERKRVAALLHDGLQQLLVAAGLQLEMAAATSTGENRKSINQAAKWIKEARSAARDLTCQLRPPALYEDGLVAALHWLASEMEERHHLNVTICGGGEPAMPISDDIKALLFECVRELLFNVAKYARVNRATVTVTEESGRLHIVVSDHGIGFDANTIGTSRQNGAFGLFSIRERLTALSGEMVMISSPGKGTRIELYIPHPGSNGAPVDRWNYLPPAEPAVRTNSEPSALDPRVKVLVVDDHPMIREGIATVLGSDDRISVSGQASNGLEAIDAVQRLSPDVVLMDVNMPRMNGIEATREISRRWPEVRIIGLSVQDDQTTAKSMLDAGAAEFISKSSALEVMIGAILHQVPYTDRNLAQAAQSES